MPQNNHLEATATPPHLLRNCLLSLEHRTYSLLQRRFSAGRVGIVAMVSGGRDSMCLLSVLAAIRRFAEFRSEFSLELVVFHANHGLRSCESDTDASFVAREALRLGLPVWTSRWEAHASHRARSQLGLQAAAREWRYEQAQACLTQAQEFWRLPAAQVLLATAHHAQDHVETVLLNIVRGTGLAGLVGLPEVSSDGTRWRPFAERTPAEIQAYVEERSLSYREDSSNASDDYDRNFLRHHIVPLLRQLRPNLEEPFLRLSRHATEALEIPAVRQECDRPASRAALRAWTVARLKATSGAPSESVINNLWDHLRRSARLPGKRFIVTVKGIGTLELKDGTVEVVL